MSTIDLVVARFLSSRTHDDSKVLNEVLHRQSLDERVRSIFIGPTFSEEISFAWAFLKHYRKLHAYFVRTIGFPIRSILIAMFDDYVHSESALDYFLDKHNLLTIAAFVRHESFKNYFALVELRKIEALLAVCKKHSVPVEITQKIVSDLMSER